MRYSSERGLTIVNDVFSVETAAAYGPFDAVMVSLVIEHLPDPAKIVEDIKQILVPGGLVCMVVPNDYNPLQKLLVKHHGFDTWWIKPKHHLNYFSVTSIVRFLETHGFLSLDIETSYPMEFFLLSGRNYVMHPEVGRACHTERMTFELALFKENKSLLCNMYRSWAKEGIGREVIVVAQKET